MKNIIVSNEFNFNEINSNLKTEVLQQVSHFPGAVKDLLKNMMGLAAKPVSIKGKQEHLDIFVRTLLQEKLFLEKYQEYGPEHPQTKAQKSSLDRSVENFEETLG